MAKKTAKTNPAKAVAAQNTKMTVPQSHDMRQTAAKLAAKLAIKENIKPDCDSETLLDCGKALCDELQLDQSHAGFAAIMLANAANRGSFAATDFSRRMLMLPRCMAIVPEVSILKQHAKQLGYEIIHADGTPSVLRVLAAGGIDAICGVACMDSLKRVFDTVRRLGAPAMAVPLNADGCCDTSADLDLLRSYIDLTTDSANAKQTGGYLAVLQQTAKIFRPEKLGQLLDTAKITTAGGCGSSTHDPAVEFLARDGKRLRPFITLAAASACSGKPSDALGDEIYLAAIAIEAFHKASLVHDDIEDGDQQRYGQPTIHAAVGIPQAINIGDYMLGTGYSIICRTAGKLTAEATAILADAHCKLALGQGEELSWRDGDGQTTPDAKNVLRSYALKTSPAFEAALRMGMLLGSGSVPDEKSDRAITLFCRHVGVAFQLLNDLQDFDSDKDAHRITFPLVLAGPKAGADAIAKARRQTSDHVDALKERALASAAEISPPAASELCTFLAELVLDNNGER